MSDVYDPTTDPAVLSHLDHYLDDALAQVNPNPSPPVSMSSRLLSVDQLHNLPPLDPMVEGLLDFDTFGLAYGRWRSCKSYTAVDLISCVATGTRWHGHPVSISPALYVVAEGVAGLAPRFDAWREDHFGTSLPPLMTKVISDYRADW